ncbi:hypothetical protein [Klebsiella pneumoniae]|uniref:hypothetical protein n=1 Tax=Klebsiella pneumoniae TaxID=573 RepID=UPI000F61C4F6|nr:hypothetical protein [Klebsiella pneumoniae]RRF43526.1 hypothetical protein EAO12_29800 [Klebsiella pneumoniae]
MTSSRKTPPLSKSAKDYRDRSDAISNDKSLSKDEKSSQLEKLNADRQKRLVDATQKRLDGYQNLVKTLQDQKASVESQLKSESLTAEQKRRSIQKISHCLSKLTI